VLILVHRISPPGSRSEPRCHLLSFLTHLRRGHQQRRILPVRPRPHNTKGMPNPRRTCPMQLPRDRIQTQGCTFRRCTGCSSHRRWNTRCAFNSWAMPKWRKCRRPSTRRKCWRRKLRLKLKPRPSIRRPKEQDRLGRSHLSLETNQPPIIWVGIVIAPIGAAPPALSPCFLET